jgi:hypothetical protein
MSPLRHPLIQVVAAVLLLSSFAQAGISLTPTEKLCLEQTGVLFKDNNELIAARHNYATSMETEMTTRTTMTAKYPENKLREYEKVCSSNGGALLTIKIDFFDCRLGNIKTDVELTLKNFANCLANTDECLKFDQENLLEEAWEELGLHCEEEDGPGGVPYDPSRTENDDKPVVLDDDLARKEEKATAGGADDMDRTEKASEYVPKEELGKKKKKSGMSFFSFILMVGFIGAVGYVVYVRKVRSRRLPWGGVTTSRFQSLGGGGGNGFVSDYHMVLGEEEFNFGVGDHELQLSSTLTT